MAKIKITSGVRESVLPKKDGGTYTKRVQDAVIETSSCKITTELDVEAGQSYVLGDYESDFEAQLKPGRFGLEMPRFWKLKLVKAAAVAAAG